MAAVILLQTAISRIHGQRAAKKFQPSNRTSPGLLLLLQKNEKPKKLFALYVINKFCNLCDHRIMVIETDKDPVIRYADRIQKGCIMQRIEPGNILL